MDQSTALSANDSEEMYPFLLIPRKCTSLETNCNTSENVFIDVSVTSVDTEGNELCIYSGFCNIKLIDNYNIDINEEQNENMYENDLPVIISESNQVNYPPYNQSQVWIDPARSPYVYNNYDMMNPSEHYSVYHQTAPGHITVEQHNTYIMQNVYNNNENVQYSVSEDVEHKKYNKTQEAQNTETNYNSYEDDEFECGVFLSQLPEEIMNEKENKAREERKYIGLQSDNGALKQLMSSDIQSMSKQRRTILFLGHSSQSGQTIQNIVVNDPMLECSGNGEVDNEVTIGEDSNPPTNPHQKKYQCDKCKQIFDQITAFKQHMVANHRSVVFDQNSKTEVKFLCTECGKTLKNQEKFEIHCMGHGDPDLECNKCHKVFASKFTLRAHRKIHTRKHVCHLCIRAYGTTEELRSHMQKMHYYFSCDLCSFVAKKFSELSRHQEIHIESDTNSLDCNGSETDIITPSPEGHGLESDNGTEIKDVTQPQYDQISDADSVIAKVMSNKIFLLHAKKVTKKHRRQNKACDVCFKKFERISDLKRHLIEHIIKSTLSKTPVSHDGTLAFECEVCHNEIFYKIDRYKAHLREHAKLTLYKCTFCDKSFSDSSNFSKHKKIHGTTFFQCDMCRRKFNSKKTLTQHIEYHNNNSPIQCQYCDKIFHFESMLNKHIKCTHKKEIMSKFRCKFCQSYFRALKDKWDHEWSVHNVRKMIVDCLICGAKFRKYSELKRHCIDRHKLDIPPAKKLLKSEK